MKLVCRICGAILSADIEELDDYGMLCEEEKKAYVPRGRFYVLGADYAYGKKGDIAVNLEDARGMKRHSDIRRLAGCCGLDGQDGKNLLCAAGHEVATEKSDCWMPHCVLFSEPDIEWRV